MTHYANYQTAHAATIAARNLNTPRVKPVKGRPEATYTAKPKRKFVVGPAKRFPNMTQHQLTNWGGVYTV